MANPAPAAPATTEPKGIQPMRNLVEGLFPPDLGASNATEVAQQNLAKIKSKSSPPAQPPVQAKLAPPESSQLKALDAFSNPKLGEPGPSVVKPGQEPAPVEQRQPEQQVEPEPAPVPEPQPEVKKLSDDLPVPGFEDDSLLAALEKKPEAKAAPTDAAPTEKILKGEAEPQPAAIEEDLDAPIVIPKKADELQAALIKTSKLLREKQKKIKELEGKGSIDMAAAAVEPLQQRIQALEAEKAQLMNVSAGASLENLPEFQQKYLRPVAMAENFIKEITKNNEGISSREIFNATQESDRAKRHAAVRTACADLHSSDALQVEQAVDAIHDIGVERDKIKGNASQIMANIQAQQQEAQAAQQATIRAQSIKAHDKVFAEFMENPVLARFAEKDPEVKTKLGAILTAAKQAEVDTRWMANHELRARAMQQAIAFPMVEKLYQNKLADVLGQLKKAQATIVNLRGPSGLSTQARQAAFAKANPSPAPVGVEAIVKGAFKNALG